MEVSEQRSIDLERLRLRQAMRYRFLKAIYDLADGDAGKPNLALPQIAKHADLTPAQADQVSRYLIHEQLINKKLPTGECSITHKGVIEIEETIEFPEKRSVHFATSVIQNYFHAHVGAVQNSGDSTAHISITDK